MTGVIGRIAPWRQTAWDWRAAGNFIGGGSGTGLLSCRRNRGGTDLSDSGTHRHGPGRRGSALCLGGNRPAVAGAQRFSPRAHVVDDARGNDGAAAVRCGYQRSGVRRQVARMDDGGACPRLSLLPGTDAAGGSRHSCVAAPVRHSAAADHGMYGRRGLVGDDADPARCASDAGVGTVAPGQSARSLDSSSMPSTAPSSPARARRAARSRFSMTSHIRSRCSTSRRSP